MKHCCPTMMGPWGGGHCMKEYWDKERMEHEYNWGHKFEEEKEVRGEQKEGWFGHKAACPSEPNKADYPMKGKKEGKPEKD
jgi:hypothetical protein